MSDSNQPKEASDEERPQFFPRIRSIGYWIFGLSILACGAMFAWFGVVGHWMLFLPALAFLLFGLNLLKDAIRPNSRNQTDF